MRLDWLGGLSDDKGWGRGSPELPARPGISFLCCAMPEPKYIQVQHCIVDKLSEHATVSAFIIKDQQQLEVRVQGELGGRARWLSPRGAAAAGRWWQASGTQSSTKPRRCKPELHSNKDCHILMPHATPGVDGGRKW